MSGKNRLFKSGKTIRLLWDFCRSRISAGFGKSAGFRPEPEPEPKSGTALVHKNSHATSMHVAQFVVSCVLRDVFLRVVTAAAA